MFGKSRPVVIETRGSRRRGAGVPRWLVLLLLGTAAGAAGVIYVQERHLPPRLSATDSARLRSSLTESDAERRRLQGELAEATGKLGASAAEGARLGEELAASRRSVDSLREDVAFVVAALPPDPRGGAVEVRAARISRAGPALAYEVALAREGARGKPLAAVMQLVVSGDSSSGAEATVGLEPVALAVGVQQVLRGTAALPAGLVPRQCTIRIVDRPGGQLLGMRVINVR
jgi:hypothetical protein